MFREFGRRNSLARVALTIRPSAGQQRYRPMSASGRLILTGDRQLVREATIHVIRRLTDRKTFRCSDGNLLGHRDACRCRVSHLVATVLAGTADTRMG